MVALLDAHYSGLYLEEFLVVDVYNVDVLSVCFGS